MLEAKTVNVLQKILPFLANLVLLMLPLLLYASGILHSVSTDTAKFLLTFHLFAVCGLVAYMAALAYRSDEKFLALTHAALLPWAVASLGADFRHLAWVEQGLPTHNILTGTGVALNLALALSLFFLFATVQVREGQRMNLRNWAAPGLLFFALGILQLLIISEEKANDALATVSGVSALVACLNLGIAWQLSRVWGERSRNLFLLAVGLQVFSHSLVLAVGKSNSGMLVMQTMYATAVLVMFFAFHRTVRFPSPQAVASVAEPAPVRERQRMPLPSRQNSVPVDDIIRPLHALIGYSEGLKADLANSLQMHVSLEMEKINHAAWQILNLLDQNRRPPVLPNLAHPISLTNDQSTFDAERFLKMLTRIAEKMALSGGTVVQTFCPKGFGIIAGDETKFLQICTATLDYMLRSARPSRLSIHIYPLKTDGQDCINIDIRDVGPGLEPGMANVLEAAFNDRLRLYTPTHSPLGLLQVKDLCDQSGVTLRVESCSGRGSTFSLSIPDRLQHVRRGLGKLAFQPSILLIDDDSRAEDMLKDLANGSNLELVRVSHVQSGLRVFYEKQPEVVIADVSSPNLESLRFIESIRSQNNSCFVISLIRKGMPDFAEQARLKGADLALEKPLSVERLLQGLGSLNTLARKTA